MKNVKDIFFDERNKSWCVHCGSWLSAVESNRDHVPSKCLLPRPLPANVPVIEVCTACNNSFAEDEEYIAGLLGVVLSGGFELNPQVHPVAAKILTNNPRLKQELQNSVDCQLDLFNEAVPFNVIPNIAKVQRVIIKNAKGHAFFEYGEPMIENPTHCWFSPLEGLSTQHRASFEDTGGGELAMWPEIGSRMMSRVITGQDICDGWVVVEPGWYRYSVDQVGIIRVRSVIREYLATEVIWQ